MIYHDTAVILTLLVKVHHCTRHRSTHQILFELTLPDLPVVRWPTYPLFQGSLAAIGLQCRTPEELSLWVCCNSVMSDGYEAICSVWRWKAVHAAACLP